MNNYFSSDERSSGILLMVLEYLKEHFGLQAQQDFLSEYFGPESSELETRLRASSYNTYHLESNLFSFLHNYSSATLNYSEGEITELFTSIGRFCFKKSGQGGLINKILPRSIRFIKGMTEFVQSSGQITMARANARTHPESGVGQLAFLYQFHPALRGRIHPGSHLIYEGFFLEQLTKGPLAKDKARDKSWVAVRYLKQNLDDLVVVVEQELFPAGVADLSGAYKTFAGDEFLSTRPYPADSQIGAVYCVNY